MDEIMTLWDALAIVLKHQGVRPCVGKTAEIPCYMCAGNGCADCCQTGRIDIWIKPCERLIEERLIAEAEQAVSDKG